MKTLEVVCGIIEKDHEFLIARRGKGIHENIWEFPGGKVEDGETCEQAVAREIKEELELDVEVLGHVCDIIDHRDDMDIHVHSYRCRIKSGKIKLHAHHEIRFVDADALFDYRFEEADIAILNAIKKASS